MPRDNRESDYGEEFDSFLKADPAEGPEDDLPDDEEEVEAETEEPEDQDSEEEAESGEEAPAEDDTDDSDEEEDSSESDQDSQDEEEPDYKSLYEKEQQRFKSLEGRFRVEKERWDELKGQLDNLREGSQGQGNRSSREETEEADEALTAFLEEFPDIADPVQKLITQQVQDALSQFQNEQLAPTAEQVQEMTAERHFKAIGEKHPDFKDLAVSGEIDEWIGSLPRIDQRNYLRVRQEGSTEEVIELLDRFKADTGKTQAAKAEPEEEEHQAPSQKRKKQVAAAQAVKGRSGGPKPSKGIRKDDFANAFDHFAK
jgi:hypothetical protein